MSGKQIKTLGTNQSQEALYPLNSKNAYICANSTITRGVCGPPASLEECFATYLGVADIAEQLGFLKTSGSSGGSSGGSEGSSGGSGGSGSTSGYSLWTGAGIPNPSLLDVFTPVDVYLDDPSTECEGVKNSADLGLDWLGCLWGTPEAAFSCTCPDIGPNFAAYLKLRLNVATFWNTPKTTPAKRAEFVDAIQYCSKIDVTVAGDFALKVGKVVLLKSDGASGYPYSSSNSKLNGYYYIIGVKHVVNNSGTHETALSLTKLPENVSNPSGSADFAADYT